MTTILGLAIGALTGWLASTLKKTRGPRSTKVDSLIGMIGALISVYCVRFFDLSSRLGGALSLTLTLVGAITLLALMKPGRKHP